MKRSSFFALLLCSLAFVSADAQQRSDLGILQLWNEVGQANADGSDVNLLHVEAEDGNGFYGPNPSSTGLTGKVFSDPSGNNSGNNSHATGVGRRIYGTGLGTAPGLGESGTTPISIYGANDWIFNALGANFDSDTSLNQAPVLQNYEVSNHSYAANAGGGFNQANLENALARMDWMVNQTDMSVVVGTGNSGATPDLFTNSYNVISVGLTNGTHSTGLTSSAGYGPGRLPVHVVGPDANFTSNSTGLISGVVSVLRQTGDGIAQASNAEVVKATLLAGATKDDVGGTWTRTESSPLDPVFGAGEANAYNSYLIQQAGQIDGEAGDPSAIAGERGWDFEENFATGDERFYEFVIGNNQKYEDFSILLNWNAEIEDTDGAAEIFIPSLDVADLTLELYDSTNGFLDQLVLDGSSDSLVDNIEHLYFTSLDAGTYHLRVANKGTGSIQTDYALAFRATAVPEPAVSVFLCLGAAMACCRRKRHTCC